MTMEDTHFVTTEESGRAATRLDGTITMEPPVWRLASFPIFFLCLAILAVLRTSWISSRLTAGRAAQSDGSDQTIQTPGAATAADQFN